MKKYLVSLTFILAVFLLPAQAFAVDFTIENTQIHAYLQENGDVQVNEQHTYQFDGDFNGITRTLIPKENTAIANFHADEDGKNLRFEEEEGLYKIYRSGSDETITVDLSYTIQDGVNVYSDLGQFYWPFFDNSNETTYENMDIYVHPPSPAEEVLAVGYGEAEATAEIEEDGIVHFKMGETESGENGDIRAAYDANLFPEADRISDQEIGKEILADIAAVEEKEAAFQSRQSLFSSLAPFVTAASSIYLLFLLIYAWKKRRRNQFEVDRSSFHHSFLPKEEMSLPAIIHYMGGITKGGSILSASLLNLVRKGFAKQINKDEFITEDKQLDHKHEKILIDWLFHQIGENGRFSLSILEDYLKDDTNKEAYQKDYAEWLKAVKEEVDQHRLFESNKTLRWVAGIMGTILIPFWILLAVHQLFAWMLSILFLSAGLIIFALVYYPRTIKGLRIRNQWKQFSKDYDIVSEKQWSEWMSDQQMQAFIYGIGIDNEHMNKKNKTLVERVPPQNTAFGGSTNDMVLLLLLSGSMTHQLNEAHQTVSASTSMPGGGAGVGGGGGGSGAF